MSIQVFNKLKAKMEELGIESEKITSVIEFAKSSEGVPADFRAEEDFTKLKKEFDSFKQLASEKEEIISNLKKKAETVEEYEQRLEEAKNKLEEKDNEYSQTIESMKFENALDRKIAQDKEINPKASNTFKGLLDKEAMKLDGDDLLGYDKQAAMVKEQHDYLIVKNKFKGNETNKTIDPNEESKDNPFKPGDTYNLTEQGKILRSDKEKAKQLINEAGLDPIKFGLK